MTESGSARGLQLLVLITLVGAIGALPSMPGLDVRAQVPAVKFDVRAAKGLPVAPFYEGWYEVDGTRYAMFGYSNRNLQEVIDIPIGPHNHLAPGPADQGQPTHFFPGINYGIFAAALRKDQTTELTWTLTANGQTLSIPASLDTQYVITPQRENGGAYPGNTPPILKFDPTGASAQGPHGIVVSRTASVSRPLTLDVWVTDDGLPPPPRRESRAPVRRSVATRPSPEGLVLGWQVYRGAGAVSLSDPIPTVEQGKARTTVTFSEPGDYMLHVQAVDSRTATRCCWTNGYVKVTVEGGGERR